MQFRDLKQQYVTLKESMDQAIAQVIDEGHFISGPQVKELEGQLAQYVGTKHCITCANGTDALTLVLMSLNIGPGDAVFVPDFTFFSSAEVVAFEGATPVFVDVLEDTFNISPDSLEEAIKKVIDEGKLIPKVIVSVDLFGLPADYARIRAIADKYNLLILEDGAQGFGGSIDGKMACSFGDIATTSFFPAKPLGCYGDGGAIFLDDDKLAELIRSLCIHGKGNDKYDNVRIGMNSRLDTIQAAILSVKLKAFMDYELDKVNEAAQRYTDKLKDYVKTPVILKHFRSSWAQYSILLKDKKERDELQKYLSDHDIPSMIYYKKPMHLQTAFNGSDSIKTKLDVSESLCERVLSLPIHPYLTKDDQDKVINACLEFIH